MKKAILSLLLIFAGCAQEHTIEKAPTPWKLYVLNADSGSYKEDKLTIKDIHSVLYFSDRPTRVAGHTSLKTFADLFEKDKPLKGVLTLLHKKGDIELTLSDPEIYAEDITFTVTKGSPPKGLDKVSLFVDLPQKTDNQ